MVFGDYKGMKTQVRYSLHSSSVAGAVPAKELAHLVNDRLISENFSGEVEAYLKAQSLVVQDF